MDYPEENDPVFIYSFTKVHINNGKDFASGLNIQMYGHIRDVYADRFKLKIAGKNDDELLLECPRIPYAILKEEKEQKKAYRQCGAMDKEVYDHESAAKIDMLSDETRHQKFYHFTFDSGDGGPLREMTPTPGTEADYDVVSYITTHQPGKKEFAVTTTLLKWTVVFTDSIESIKQPKAVNETKGKSKFDLMEEGMENLTIAPSLSEG
jgi:hypothetical protein